MSINHWRFEDLEIWQLAAKLAVDFHAVADGLCEKRCYRYAEQLRAAGISVVNNIAEGSASLHTNEFRQFLNIARRSVWENASMLLVFEMMNIVDHAQAQPLLDRLSTLSRKIMSFIKGMG